MNHPTDVHARVADAYARAVNAPGPNTCCGDGCGPKGVAVQAAGYAQTDLDALPADAVANSFGCGNPLAFSGVELGDTVVDLGSGAGIDLLIAARRTGPTGRVIGIDMTDAMIERARANVAVAGLDNVEVRKGYIEELPVESDTADWVISNCVINLSPRKDRVFAEIARVLKPGGRMLVSDLVVENLPESVRTLPTVYESCIGGAISEAEYLDGLRRAGLVEVEVRTRHVYDRAQLEALLLSEAPSEVPDAASLAQAIDGRVASVSVYARKAGA